jgi:hypothetical protein
MDVMKKKISEVDASGNDQKSENQAGSGKEAAVLKPCGKPQAQEAQRLNDKDEACDEGVR